MPPTSPPSCRPSAGRPPGGWSPPRSGSPRSAPSGRRSCPGPPTSGSPCGSRPTATYEAWLLDLAARPVHRAARPRRLGRAPSSSSRARSRRPRWPRRGVTSRPPSCTARSTPGGTARSARTTCTRCSCAGHGAGREPARVRSRAGHACAASCSTTTAARSSSPASGRGWTGEHRRRRDALRHRPARGRPVRPGPAGPACGAAPPGRPAACSSTSGRRTSGPRRARCPAPWSSSATSWSGGSTRRSDARLPQASYDLHVIVLCSEGYTSSLAAHALQQLGIRRATDVVGGFQAWARAGLPATGAGHAGTAGRGARAGRPVRRTPPRCTSTATGGPSTSRARRSS